MPLPTFATLEEVPEPFRSYAREDAGRIVLDLVEGADVVGLRQNAATLLTEKKALQAKYADVDVDEYRNLKTGKKTDIDARLTAAALEKAELQSQLAAIGTARRTDVKRAEIMRALADAGGTVELLEPIVSTMVDVEDIDGRMHVIVRDAQGTPRYKDGAGTRFGLSDLLAEMKAKPTFQPAFNVKVGSGGGAAPGGAGGPMRVIDASDKKAVLANLDDIRTGKARLAS